MALTDDQMRDALRQCPHDTIENLRVRWLYAKDFARAIESAACAERDACIANIERALEKAERTLTAACYTDEGGELWKPPIGPAHRELLDRIAELMAERDEWKHEAVNGGNAQYLREKNAELERQLAEARKDAERYRWLRDVAHPDYGPAVAEHQCNDWGKWYYAFPSSTELDATIDNAMQKG